MATTGIPNLQFVVYEDWLECAVYSLFWLRAIAGVVAVDCASFARLILHVFLK